MEKYRVNFKDSRGRRYYIDCNSMAEVKAVITEEKITGSTYLNTEETKKRSVICSVFFLAVGIIGILADGNIGLLAMCSVLSWATLTEEWKSAVSRIFRLEA